MNYATWKLNFTDSDYGTGPEEKILELGSKAEGAWVDGVIEEGGTIIGYVESPQDEIELAIWEFQNITQEEALDFCLSINPEAYLSEDGRILAPIEEREF
jgi:hypothetical protein